MFIAKNTGLMWHILVQSQTLIPKTARVLQQWLKMNRKFKNGDNSTYNVKYFKITK